MYLEDLKCVRRLTEGDERSWDVVTRGYAPFYEFLAREAGLSDEDARDCIQKSIGALCETGNTVLAGYKGLSSFKTYFARVIYKDCLDFIRKENRQKRKVLRKSGAYILEDPDNGPEGVLEKIDIETLLSGLGPREKLLVKLRYYDGLSREEVAVFFSVEPTVVDVWYFRLKTKLRKIAGVDDKTEGENKRGEKRGGIFSWLI